MPDETILTFDQLVDAVTLRVRKGRLAAQSRTSRIASPELDAPLTLDELILRDPRIGRLYWRVKRTRKGRSGLNSKDAVMVLHRDGFHAEMVKLVGYGRKGGGDPILHTKAAFVVVSRALYDALHRK